MRRSCTAAVAPDQASARPMRLTPRRRPHAAATIHHRTTTRFVFNCFHLSPGNETRNEAPGVYLQIYNAAIDQTTLRPAADAEYGLLKNGKELAKQIEDWRQINDAGQRLTLSRLIDSRSLEPGEYQIQIRIRDRVSGQTITPSGTFTLVP
jgi:hypothetical protein